MLDKARNRKRELIETLRREILTLGRVPGSDLDEASLASEFGLSRTPLREVLRQLAGEGYVILRENFGAYVSEMSHYALRNLFLTAPMIYAAIARMAAQNAKQGQIESLKQAQAEFVAALSNGSVGDRTLANYRFHAIIGEMADNYYLTPSLNRLLIDHARIGMTFYRPQTAEMAERLAEASHQHDEFIEAIDNRDELRAADLAYAHWQLSRDQIELFVMPGPLELGMDLTNHESA